ncbi:TPA: hypothetical protein OUE07_004437 [Citrobacter koseri]|nr:hypothetical protein [Citrobacter koseri]
MKSTVETKICELVKLGHELAKELHCAESAALVRDLASQLEVQFARSNALAAENVGLLNFITTRCYVFDGTWTGDLSDYYSPAEEVMPETPATDAYLAGIKADGVDYVAHKFRVRAQNSLPVGGWIDAARAAEDFAKQLREGAK